MGDEGGEWGGWEGEEVVEALRFWLDGGETEVWQWRGVKPVFGQHPGGAELEEWGRFPLTVFAGLAPYNYCTPQQRLVKNGMEFEKGPAFETLASKFTHTFCNLT